MGSVGCKAPSRFRLCHRGLLQRYAGRALSAKTTKSTRYDVYCAVHQVTRAQGQAHTRQQETEPQCRAARLQRAPWAGHAAATGALGEGGAGSRVAQVTIASPSTEFERVTLQGKLGSPGKPLPSDPYCVDRRGTHTDKARTRQGAERRRQDSGAQAPRRAQLSGERGRRGLCLCLCLSV